ncbi:hypothetical protein [Rhodococcus sp. (in: high G+C Gram-positive bacteria)]|uniref:hypothetical protein n=1 Tax=Rhodococcus sp. TaxID=1831 RepID=UPI003BB1EDAB
MDNVGRSDVRLGVRPQDIDLDGAGHLTRRWADHLLLLERPAPHVCAVHGEPELERKETTILSDPAPRTRLMSGAKDSSRPSGRYVVAVEWPICGRCVSRRRLWRKAAFGALAAFAGAVTVLVIAAQAVEKNDAVLSLSFFAAFGLFFLAVKLNYRATLIAGVSLALDGSAVLVRQAHPDFARSVKRL